MDRFQPVPRMIWRNDKFPFLSKDLQLVWFHLMTTPSGTPLGLVYGSAESLAAELRQKAGWYRKRLGEGEETGLWKYDDRNHVVYLAEYWTQSQNRPGNPNILTSWLKFIEEIPQSPLKIECLTELEQCCRTLGDGYLEVLEAAADKFRKAIETSSEGLPEGSLKGSPEGSASVRRIQEQETCTGNKKKSKKSCGEMSASALSPPSPDFLSENNSKTPHEHQPECLPERSSEGLQKGSADGSPESIFCELQCAGSKPVFQVTESCILQKQKLFPEIDVRHETLKAADWLIANPKRRKTHNGVMPFLWNWYSRAQGGTRASPYPKQPLTASASKPEAPPKEKQNPFFDLQHDEQPEEWIRALASIRESVGDHSFETWFRPVVCREIKDDALHLAVPTESFQTCLLEHFKPLLLESTGARELTIQHFGAYC